MKKVNIFSTALIVTSLLSSHVVLAANSLSSDSSEIQSSESQSNKEETSSTEENIPEKKVSSEIKDVVELSTADEVISKVKEKEEQTKEQSTKDSKIDSKLEKVINTRGSSFPLNDFHWTSTTVDGKLVVTLNSIKDGVTGELRVPTYYQRTDGRIVPTYISKDLFKNNKKITKISFYSQLEGTPPGKIFDPKTNSVTTDASELFMNMTSLKEVDFNKVDLHDMDDMSSMFKGCTSLETVDNIDTLDTSGVTIFDGMFEGCIKLHNVDFSNFDVSHGSSFDNMFLNCENLYEIKMQGLGQGISMQSMFQNTAVVYAQLLFKSDSTIPGNVRNLFTLPKDKEYLPLLIYSNSPAFYQKESKDIRFYDYYDFAGDGRVLPSIIVSGEGRFKSTPGYISTFDSSYTEKDKYHNEKICILSDVTQGYTTKSNPLSQLENIKPVVNKAITTVKAFPTLKNPNFGPGKNPYIADLSQYYSGYYDNHTEERYKPWASIFDDTPQYIKNIFIKYTAQYSPVNPEMSNGHTVNSKNSTSKKWPDNRIPLSELGFAYQPSTLEGNNIVLDGTSKQTKLTSDKQENFHIGVRDYTQNPTSWTVNAQLTWNDPLMKDAQIQCSGGEIKLNTNNINNKTNKPIPFNDSQLKMYTAGNVKNIQTSQYNLIPNQKVQLMNANGNQKRGFYDLTLGNMKLITQDDNKMPASSYNGQIDWNLSVGPNGH